MRQKWFHMRRGQVRRKSFRCECMPRELSLGAKPHDPLQRASATTGDGIGEGIRALPLTPSGNNLVPLYRVLHQARLHLIWLNLESDPGPATTVITLLLVVHICPLSASTTSKFFSVAMSGADRQWLQISHPQLIWSNCLNGITEMGSIRPFNGHRVSQISLHEQATILWFLHLPS